MATYDFQTENFTILLSWEVQRANDIYIITVNMTGTGITYNTTMPTFMLKGFYSVLMLISLVGINCVGHQRVGRLSM